MRLHLQTVVTVVIASAAVALLFAEINAPAATAIDPTSAIRGSLGVALGDLSVSENLGRLSLLLNGAFALLFGVSASLAVAGLRRARVNQSQYQSDDQSGQTVHLA